MTHHKLDTDTHVYFYEQEFYVLSNFSAFQLQWCGHVFMTSEHAYQWSKFRYEPDSALPVYESIRLSGRLVAIRRDIMQARSAHDAFKKAQLHADYIKPNWNGVKLRVMHDILREKASQHEYVRRKLEETGDRILVEDSWRDNCWGIGSNGKGYNHLGVLWMQVREEMRGGYGRKAVQ